jgi:hypothetical protein
VETAVICLRISAALTVVLTLLQLMGVLASAGAAQTAITGFVTAGLLILVAEKINAGRGWAVVLFAVIYGLGSFFFVLSLLLAPQTFLALPATLQTSAVVQFALQTAALVCVLSQSSRAWLKRRNATTEGAI